MLIGIVGKTNVGKSCLFSAATLVDAEISSRIFTTIEPNKGVTYVRVECPCKKLGVKCNPNNSKCIDGTRYVPIKVIDVAGLVPGAHEGRGLGNKFLSDIMEADALIHVVDISGSTDSEGMIVPAGSHNPAEDIEFLEKEVDYWILGILNKLNLSKRMDIKDEQFVEAIYKQLSGLGVKQLDVDYAIKKTGLKPNSSEDNYLEFIEILRKKSKPMIVAANKIDISGAYELFEKVKMSFPTIIPCCAEAELALRRAAEHNLIKYMPGDSDFSITQEMDAKHRNALEFIRNNILKKYGSTGVQKVIDETTFSLLNMIVVYPVENEHKFTDSRGRILPDAHLIKRGTTVKEFASKIHTDFSEKYICAIDARTGKRIGDEHALQNGDIVKILIRH